jgi:uncharacterized protein (DUF4415 family)
MNDDNSKYHVSDGGTLTPAEAARLDELEARLGASVDIPETSDAAWAMAIRGRHADATEAAIAIRLDADVLAWLRAKGPGYRAEISRILRERMLQED